VSKGEGKGKRLAGKQEQTEQKEEVAQKLKLKMENFTYTPVVLHCKNEFKRIAGTDLLIPTAPASSSPLQEE
jgi:hypothetical protein